MMRQLTTRCERSLLDLDPALVDDDGHALWEGGPVVHLRPEDRAALRAMRDQLRSTPPPPPLDDLQKEAVAAAVAAAAKHTRKRRPRSTTLAKAAKAGVEITVAPDGTTIYRPAPEIAPIEPTDTDTGNEWDRLQ
jgi:hypothetical protein